MTRVFEIDHSRFEIKPAHGKRSGPIAEWFSHEEMIKLQGVSVSVSVNVREWQCKDTVDEIKDQVWDCLAEEWAVHV